MHDQHLAPLALTMELELFDGGAMRVWPVLVFLLLLPLNAFALPDDSYSISFGAWDAFQDRRAAETGAEYRLTSWQLFADEPGYRLAPTIGLLLTSAQITYLYTGLRFEIPLDNKRIFFIPHSAVGYYRDSAQDDMGGPLEFRNGVELAYAFHKRARVGLNFFHVSNANVYQSNPGAETLAVTMQFSLSELKSQPSEKD